jgi:hypothetical protein
VERFPCVKEAIVPEDIVDSDLGFLEGSFSRESFKKGGVYLDILRDFYT